MSAPISQKEYLRKYLSGASSSTKKKKKKKPKPVAQGMKIIDDDVDLSKMRALEDDEIDVFGDPEDAPLVVGIVDDRPDEIRFTTKKWKIVNQNDGIDSTTTVEQIGENKKSKDGDSPNGNDSDLSPSRVNNSVDSDMSPDRGLNTNIKAKVEKENQSDSDLSPERNTQHKSKESKNRPSSDSSPPRKKKIQHNSNRKTDKKRKQKDTDSDLSPDRNVENKTKRNDSDSDLSPIRDNNAKANRYNNNKSRRYGSPPRNQERESNRKSRWDSDDFVNSRRNDNRYQDNHGRRNNDYNRNSRQDRRESGRNGNSDFSRDNNRHKDDRNRYDNDKNEAGPSGKSKKTLDGKKAGLQAAQQLKDETDLMRRKEDEMFSKLSDEYTGRNAQTIKRDIRRGKRETEAEKQEKIERELKQKELEAKYSRWGKGLKQVEEQESRLQNYVHEASKPLARYKDDKDLEEELKGRERIGDPMLEYMRKKEREKGGPGETENRPIYQGAYPMNRFDIRPGHRWDGVDRSSGYEKSYFEAKNSKKAQEEEIYKWSTEDM